MALACAKVYARTMTSWFQFAVVPAGRGIVRKCLGGLAMPLGNSPAQAATSFSRGGSNARLRGAKGRTWVGLGQRTQPSPHGVLRNAREGSLGCPCNPRRFKQKRPHWAAALGARPVARLFGTSVAVSTGNKLCLTLKPCGRLSGRPCGAFVIVVFDLRFGPTRARQHTPQSPACQNPGSMRRVAWSARFELSQRR
jgi:hypothetical protein